MHYDTFAAVVEDTNQAREDFFKLVFGPSAKGFICLAFLEANQKKRNMREYWFSYPEELPEMLKCIVDNSKVLAEAYFCPQLFKARRRIKDNVSTCTTVWADLDSCDPALVNVTPTVVTQTSPERFQAFWVLDKPVQPNVAEDISRRIAYFHASQGADRSGWDLSQLLRIPYTPNFKYGDLETAPIVAIIKANNLIYRPSEFTNQYPEVPAIEFAAEDAPPLTDEDPLHILQRYRTKLNPYVFDIYANAPEEGEWSEQLWKLIQVCIEAGISRQETLTIANSAACNKYVRDKRPLRDLWNEVCRGYIKHLEITNSIPNPETVLHELLTPEEIKLAQSRESFIERYIQWAQSATDASPQYHQAGAFSLLASMIASTVKLETSYGDVIPNLWFAILGETTITRKTTAMKLAVKLIQEVDEDIIVATDGTSEGILTGLSNRDGLASMFYRDEITGLFQSFLSKDYMSDMPETLTKLYDGDLIKRVLRKEEITVKDPIFMILCGGIKEKVQLMLSEEHIASGFIPRFVFITAKADISRMRPIGPKITGNNEWREAIKNEIQDVKIHYNTPVEVMQGNKFIGAEKPSFIARLTDDAWQRYNDFEYLMIKSALDTGLSYLTPVYDRLAKSTLKAAMLIAASRQRSVDVLVDVADLVHAIYYCQQWQTYANDVVSGVGKSADERLMETMLQKIKLSPKGKTRHELMREHQLTKKAANELFSTMEQRQWIDGTSIGRDIRYHAI